MSRKRAYIFGLFTILAALAFLAFSVENLPVNIPLVNPGFENGFKGWAAKFSNMFSIDTTERHSGNASLKVSNPEGNSNPLCHQSAMNLEVYATYRLRAWIKGEKGQSAIATIMIEYYNDKGKNTSGFSKKVGTIPDGRWQPIELILRADSDTKKAGLLLGLFRSGTVYFDDVEFTKVKEPQIIFLAPPRVAAPPLRSKDITIQVRTRIDVTTRIQPIFTFDIQRVGSSDVTPAKADLKPKGTGVWEAAVHLPVLQPGQYKLRCSIANSKISEDIPLSVPPTRQKPEFLSDTGTILVGGKPFFPIGLYDARPSEYEALVENGFNCTVGLSSLDLTDFANSISAATRAGIMIDVPLYVGGQVMKNMSHSLRKIQAFGSDASILNWKIVDEPDHRPDIIDEVPAAYEQLKQADPRHPLLLTIDFPENYNYWSNFCDILQIDPYPIPEHSLTRVSDFTARAKAALQPWQNLTVVLQAGWKSNPMNQPTFDQARCMLYLALINGAKGIFWYTMHFQKWDLTKTPLWTQIKEINRETLELSKPVMMGAKIDGVKGITAPLQASCLKYEEKLFLLLANPASVGFEATIELPVEIKKATARSASQIELKGRFIKLRIPGPGADLVLIEKK